MNREVNGNTGVDGNTAVYGVIGNPVGHSFSPQIHGYLAELCGLNMAYMPFCVSDHLVQDAICGAYALGIKGLNVTVPHKKAVMSHIVDIDDMARQIDAVNTLVWTKGGYKGYNTDHIGIDRTIADLGMTFSERTVAIIGAGGSAYAAGVAAAKGKARHIVILNRTQENARLLALHINRHYNTPVTFSNLDGQVLNGQVLDEQVDIVIQTTTVGFGQAVGKSPVAPGFFKGVQLAFDIIYTPWETEFLRLAKSLGFPLVTNGFPMLVHQAVAAFNLWHGGILEGIIHDKHDKNDRHDKHDKRDKRDKKMETHIKTLEGQFRLYSG